MQDGYRHYVGGFNTERLPTYFAVDLTAFKTFDVFSRKMDLGLQVFNLTNHFNPRDVICGHRLAPLPGADQQPRA